jgi:UDP-N-acetylmuramoyl-tripeptide--D-alanyl-D-alanine ligase
VSLESTVPKLADFVQSLLQAGLIPPDAAAVAQTEAIEFSSISTDSRSIEPGQLFVALVGENFDGHVFVQRALDRGAAAAVVNQGVVSAATGLLIPVTDTLLALQAWATTWRSGWQGQLVAVTGSNGKTTVKKMISDIFRAHAGSGRIWATPGNLNNHIGVPLSVLGLRPSHEFAVLELGMNHPGEIAALAAIAQPQIALVNNAQREHQEFMKSVKAVAAENGQVFTTLPQSGVAVFPKDPLYEPIWSALANGRRMIRFGFEDDPASPGFFGEEVSGSWKTEIVKKSIWNDRSVAKTHLNIRVADQKEIEIQLTSPGRHVALNTLAAVACAYAAGCSFTAIKEALDDFTPVHGRGEQLALAAGGQLIDDTYNANPDSVLAAINALVMLPKPRALVLGDMGEVGEQGQAFHEEVLRYAQQQEIDVIWLHGDAMESAGADTGIGRAFEHIEDLIADLKNWLEVQQIAHMAPSIWVKGSRFMRMERVIHGLMSATTAEEKCS